MWFFSGATLSSCNFPHSSKKSLHPICIALLRFFAWLLIIKNKQKNVWFLYFHLLSVLSTGLSAVFSSRAPPRPPPFSLCSARLNSAWTFMWTLAELCSTDPLIYIQREAQQTLIHVGLLGHAGAQQLQRKPANHETRQTANLKSRAGCIRIGERKEGKKEKRKRRELQNNRGRQKKMTQTSDSGSKATHVMKPKWSREKKEAKTVTCNPIKRRSRY